MWVTALVLGFAGSLHCAGMCSPLALAVTNMTPSVLLNRFLYNAGRIFTYGMLGAAFSVAGSLLPIAGFQNLLSIALGTALLIFGLGGIKGIHLPLVTQWLQRFTFFLKAKFSGYIKVKTSGSVMLLGALNGFLPCGLTFLGFTYCITLEGPLDGFNFMLLFGAGTLPVMLGFTSLLFVLVKKFQINAQRLSTGLLMLSGIFLIARVFLMAGWEAHAHSERLIDVLCR